jgi:transcriptional regulator with XRE-family HTH domain
MSKSATSIDLHVGRRLRLRREILGLTQTALGERLGVAFQQIQKYEIGINRIGAGRLQQAARILEVPVEYFFAGAPPQGSSLGSATKDDALSQMLSTKEGLLLNLAFLRVKDRKLQRSILELVKAAAEVADDPRPRVNGAQPSKRRGSGLGALSG